MLLCHNNKLKKCLPWIPIANNWFLIINLAW
jgi:hypothetical protein